MSTTKAKILTEFTDAGSGERFIAGDVRDLDAGTFGNYEAAGLVEKHKTAPASSVAKTSAKSAAKPKSNSKPKAAVAASPATNSAEPAAPPSAE